MLQKQPSALSRLKDPDPVVVPVAVDETNALAKQKANEVCTLDPLPTAPRVAPDVNDGTWQSGVASAYSIETNDDGQGNFGVTNTASGIALTHQSVTVAVPEDKSYLVGSICEICYNGKVVIATVTDTGGFAKYGRALDLAPAFTKPSVLAAIPTGARETCTTDSFNVQRRPVGRRFSFPRRMFSIVVMRGL